MDGTIASGIYASTARLGVSSSDGAGISGCQRLAMTVYELTVHHDHGIFLPSGACILSIDGSTKTVMGSRCGNCAQEVVSCCALKITAKSDELQKRATELLRLRYPERAQRRILRPVSCSG